MVVKLYKLSRKYKGDPAKLALIDSLINKLVVAWEHAYTMALRSFAEVAETVPEPKELSG